VAIVGTGTAAAGSGALLISELTSILAGAGPAGWLAAALIFLAASSMIGTGFVAGNEGVQILSGND